MTRVLHLVGSAVDDAYADLSRLYAADCLAHADRDCYEHHVAWVEPGGRWRFPADLSRAALAAAPSVPLAEAVAVLRDLAPDVAVPQMFCVPGMTTYRGLLDLLDIPYVGNPPDVMALGAHKGRAKAVVAAAGVAVPAGALVRPGDPRPDLGHLPLPVVVKPADADNSAGLALVHDPADLAAAVAAAAAAAPSGEVLVEEYVELGREVRCGVLDLGGQGEELVCLPLEEYGVHPEGKPIRDAADKLSGSGDDLTLVAKDLEHAWIVDADDVVVPAVHAAARAAHRALGCRDYGLFDFRIDPTGRPVFLEAGLYCSFASTSVVTVMAAAAGTALSDLFARGLAQATTRR